METVYLKSGQACHLIEKIGEKFIVAKLYEQTSYDGEETLEIDGESIVVNEVFSTPPIEMIATEIKDMEAQKEALQVELSELNLSRLYIKNDIAQLTKNQVNSEKFIINKTDLLNAKTIALFHKDRIMPFLLDKNDKSFYGLKMSIEIKIGVNEERSWGYKMYFDCSNNYGDFLCPKYGFIINPTQEQIDDTIKKRVMEFDFSTYYLKETDDKYLTDELRQKKRNYIDDENRKKKNKLIVDIQDMQKKLELLES